MSLFMIGQIIGISVAVITVIVNQFPKRWQIHARVYGDQFLINIKCVFCGGKLCGMSW